jgi:hypothetical protein
MPRAGNYAPSQRPPGIGAERKDRAVAREQLEPRHRGQFGAPSCMTAIGNTLVVASGYGLLIRDSSGGSAWCDFSDTTISIDNRPQLLAPLWDDQFLLADSHYEGAHRFDLSGKCLGLLGHGGGLDDSIENVVVDPRARAFIARSGSELIHWSEKNGLSTDALGRDEALAIVSVDQGRLCECLWTSHDDEDEEPAWIHTLETATGRLVDNRPGPRIISAGEIDLAVSLPTGEALVITDAWNDDAHVYRRSSDGTWRAQGEKPGALRWDFILLRGTLDALAAEDGPICLKSSGQVLPCPNLPRDAKLAQLESGLVACVSTHWELSLWEPETLCGAE